MLVSLKDLCLATSPASFSDAVISAMFGGLLYAAYSLLTMVALLYTEDSCACLVMLAS